ncbi:anthranilate phosphoribosyltransferase [Shouchella shacheensis]|uniref:anthranilate phosphoribosyltransferase n=1 Tax=Shouchella shacheensis TaxID=1649580 RepID=UPI00074036C7|nr:anthranilate phosphoribosyltransferase [Shouchella shacheensis]
MIKEMLTKCMNHETLMEHEAEVLMNAIMNGEATPSQIASILTVLRFRGETADEITGFARGMRSFATALPHTLPGVIDTCGTGGDSLGTFNISTATALVLASLDVPVAKHGNRSVSSKSGSADVLEQLGVDIQSSSEEAAKQLATNHLCFLFAPLYHQSMKHAVSPRKEIGFRTIFNILGPLTNPARAQHQLIGVYDFDVAKKMGEALQRLGTKHALLVTGADGLDECAIHGETQVVEVREEELTTFTLSPKDVGLNRGRLEDIQVETPFESASLIRDILQNRANEAATSIVALNAGAALYAADRASSIAEGVHQAQKAIQQQQTLRYVERMQVEREGAKHAY